MTKNAVVIGKNQLTDSLTAGLEKLNYTVSTDSTSTNLVVWVQNLPKQQTLLVEQSLDDWITYCEEEIKSAIDTTKKFYPSLKSNSGVIIFVIPIIAMSGGKGFAASAGAGEAVRVLSKGLARLWGEYKIRIHTLAIDISHFTNASLDETRSLGSPAFDHIGKPETDLAQIINLLARDEASFLTGSTLCADGGNWMI